MVSDSIILRFLCTEIVSGTSQTRQVHTSENGFRFVRYYRERTSRQPWQLPSINFGLLGPPSKGVWVDYSPLPCSDGSRVWREGWTLLDGLQREPDGSLPELLRTLPRYWHNPILSRKQALHETRGDSN